MILIAIVIIFVIVVESNKNQNIGKSFLHTNPVINPDLSNEVERVNRMLVYINNNKIKDDFYNKNYSDSSKLPCSLRTINYE